MAKNYSNHFNYFNSLKAFAQANKVGDGVLYSPKLRKLRKPDNLPLNVLLC